MKKFKKAIQNTPDISNAYCVGLGALERSARAKIENPDNIRITGSVNLDESLKGRYPQANRWDYGIGIVGETRKEEAIWVEVHRGTADEIEVMIKKVLWLREWLNTSGRLLGVFKSRFIWISTGPTGFTSTSIQARRIAAYGLKNVGGQYKIAV